MSSETREIAHDQHSHPVHGTGMYWLIGGVLVALTVVEILLYYMEDVWHMISEGVAVPSILILSAAKFILVVMFYMHLKYDSNTFTGVFLFPAALATLLIVGMILLYHVLPVIGLGLWN